MSHPPRQNFTQNLQRKIYAIFYMLVPPSYVGFEDFPSVVNEIEIRQPNVVWLSIVVIDVN